MHDRLRDDDLPRFEEEFKAYLNTNTIRDIATFQSQLNRQLDLIRSRVGTINESLVSIDYNPDRYIRLESNATPNVEIREFRSELRACTDNSLSGEDPDQYSEQKFLQVKRIIERFRGREGQTEIDRAWTRRVTDVRQWFVFSASERWRADDERARALHRLRRQVRWPEGEARLHHPRGVARVPVQAGVGCDPVADLPVRGDRRGVRPRLRRVDPVRALAVPAARPAVADRHAAAEDPRHRAVRVRGWFRRQPERRLLPAADADASRSTASGSSPAPRAATGEQAS